MLYDTRHVLYEIRERDVLLCMYTTLDMSHFATSLLNLEAPLNTTRNERSKYDEEEKIKKVSFQRFRGLLYDRRHVL